MPLDVICPHCGECFFETNDLTRLVRQNEDPRGILFRRFKDVFNPSDFVRKYDPDQEANAAMIRMKEKFKQDRQDIPHDADLRSEGIGPCPECNNPLSDDNYAFITREQEPVMIEDDDYDGTECRYCDRDFPTSKGRIIHEKKWCKDRPTA